MHGVCREGENCKYSHDLKDKPSMVCDHYQYIYLLIDTAQKRCQHLNNNTYTP